MPLYEHVFIARQDISNTQAEGLIEHFGKVLEDNGGKVVGTEYWGLKNLAFKIQKNRKGHYGFMRTDSPAEAVKEMERLMRIHDDIVRVMTIKVDEHEEGPSAVLSNKGRDDRDRGRGPRGDRGDRGDRGPRGDRGGDRGDRASDRRERDEART